MRAHRYGIEFNNHDVASDWLMLDGDIAFSQARFDQPQGDAANAGRYVPGSVRTVVSLGATVTQWGPWFGQFQLRYFGPRPQVEGNSQRSKGTTLAYLRAGYRIAVDAQVDEGELAHPSLHLESDAKRPDILELERRLLPDDLALVPRLAMSVVASYSHDGLPSS